MRQLPDEKQLLELLEMAKIVERQMIEVGQVIAAVDEKSAKRLDEFREAQLQNKEVSGV
jgi:aminoglycoside phosphotransferase family enzyme